MSGFAAGLITGLLDFGSQVINNFEKKNAAFDERLYNAPSNQVNRLLKAGLNPYAFAPQVAANNTSQAFPAGEVDFGGSAGKAVQAYSTAEQRNIQRQLSSMQMQSIQADITGKKLDNQYKAQTLNDRVKLQEYNTKKAFLDTQLRQGLIDKQQYDNEIARLNADFVKWKSGQWSETFGDPNDTYESAPLVQEWDVGYDAKSAKMRKAQSEARISQVQADIYEKMKPFLEMEAKYKGKITEAQYQYWYNHALREQVARIYEQSSNMPWNNRQVWMHILDSVTQLARQYQKDNPGAGFFQSMWNGLKEYVGVKGYRPPIHKSSRPQPGRVPAAPVDLPPGFPSISTGILN